MAAQVLHHETIHFSTLDNCDDIEIWCLNHPKAAIQWAQITIENSAWHVIYLE